MNRAMARANAYTILSTSTPVAAALCKRRYQARGLAAARLPRVGRAGPGPSRVGLGSTGRGARIESCNPVRG